MRKHYDFSKGWRGAVIRQDTKDKSRITMWLDDAVLDWFRQQVEAAGGGDYQSLINSALREHIARKREPLEER